GVENHRGVGGAAHLDELAGEIVRHHQADLAQRHAALRVVGCDTKIAVQGELEAAGDRRSLNSRNRDRGKLLQAMENALEARGIMTRLRLFNFGQIDTRAEMATLSA